MPSTSDDPSTPTFSVVIPTWNRARIVGRAVRSVLAQNFGDFEVIVVDDGSSDDTQDVLRTFADPRLRVVTRSNGGESAARNSGAAVAAGRYLIFLDSDDEARPDWLSSMNEGLTHAGADVVICGQEALDDAGRQVRVWVPSPHSTPDEMAVRFEAGQVAMRREVFMAVGGYETGIGYGQHTELAVRLFLRSGESFSVAVVPRALAVVHRQADRDYGANVVESARFVLERYPDLRTRFPHLSGSYHAMVGVDLARRGDLASARRHFLAAVRSEPGQWRHAVRLSASLSRPIARIAWPGAAV